MISLLSLYEELQGNPKALILAGSPGSGKSSVLSKLNLKGIKILNVDDIITSAAKTDNFSLDLKNAGAEDRSKYGFAQQKANKALKTKLLPDTIASKESFILDGTSASYNNAVKLKKELEEKGYDVAMLYIYASLIEALERNEKRFEKSGGRDRSLLPFTVMDTWFKVTQNFDLYQQLFGNNFIPVSTSGENETISSVKDVFEKYITPYLPKDTKPQTEKEKIKNREKSEQFSQDLQFFLNSDKTRNILHSSLSIEDVKSKINSFFNK